MSERTEETGMALTATRLLEMDSTARLARTVHHLLDRLRPFMRAYTRTPDDTMPEHRLVWVDDAVTRDGPGQTILQALKEHPELWSPALPDDCCIVSRKQLERCVSADVAEVLASYGADLVLRSAAQARYEAEDRRRAERARLGEP
jgi:molybdopterin-guanine dinucleotide biosynthesis protein A